MGRSVSYPAGAQVAFRILDPDQPEDADWEYETLRDDILTQACAAFPSFDPCNGWRGREDRILLRNSYCDIGVSSYGRIAAVWIAERDDPAYHDADGAARLLTRTLGAHIAELAARDQAIGDARPSMLAAGRT